MSISKKISRIIFTCLWLLAGAGLVVLLLAAMNTRRNQVCKGYEVLINSQVPGNWFIDKNDIVNTLTDHGRLTLNGKSIASFHLGQIEQELKKEVWVKDADLYFDNNGVLKVRVEERSPIARIFSVDGSSFYLDSTGRRLPLSDKMSVKLPVFTGFPSGLTKWRTAADKKLVRQISGISLYLMGNPFWMAQVSQVDITPDRQFELIPTIGNHVVEMGDGNDYEQKFKRLFVFYKQVLAKTGMDKYRRIKVQYAGEVIGVKTDSKEGQADALSSKP